MDAKLAKRELNALKDIISTLKDELKVAKELMEKPGISVEAYKKQADAVDALTQKIKILSKLQRSATPTDAYAGFISGDLQNSNTLRQAQRGAKNRMNSVAYASGADAETRRFLDDIDKAQMKLNRLQAGFVKPLQAVKKELNDLSSNEMSRLLQLLQQEQQLMSQNSQAWAAYGRAIEHVKQRMLEYNDETKRAVGAETLKKAQQGGFATANQQQIQRAIDKLKEYQTVINDPAGSGQAAVKAAGVEIQKLITQLDALKQKASEETVNAKLQLMTSRLANLGKLSDSALAETKKFWQAQYEGAERGSQAYKNAEAALKSITELENTRKNEQSNKVLSNMGLYGDEEIRKAIQAFEQLRDAQAHGSTEWDKYNQKVLEGKKYLDDWAKADAIMRFEGQMSKLTLLSDAALQETKKFWEAMVAGAEKGTSELKGYEAYLAKISQEERERRQLANEQAVEKLGGGNLGQYSEAEIRKAIEAGKELIQTYKTADPEAKKLAENIVRAERYLEQYGVAAERAAQRESDAVRLMQDQLQKGSALTASALKAQEQYWQRLIDDPKTAASSLQQYQANLEKVKQLQQRMQDMAGIKALAFFRGDTSNASADQIKQQADALKKFRDSLPKQDNAEIIAEIDDYLAKAGQAAQKSAEQVMSLDDALALAAQAGGKDFAGTAQSLKQAQKAIEEGIATTGKSEAEYEKLRQALARVKAEMAGAGMSSDRMRKILADPKSEKSVDNLKNAIARARAEMEVLAQEIAAAQAAGKTGDVKKLSKEYSDLATQAKKADGALKDLEKQSKGTATAFEKAWSRLKTYIGLYVSAAVAMQKIAATFSKINELSDKMGEVGKTTGMTAEEIDSLQASLARINTRTAIGELMGLSAAAGQLGLKGEQDILAFTRAANMITVALPEMGREGVTELMKVAQATGTVADLQRQMDAGLIQDSNAVEAALTRVGSTIDALRANSASAAPKITDFVQRVGAVGAQSGISMDQVAALGSTVDALGMRVEMSATALSRMIPAIKNNAFAIAQALDVPPEEITNLFEAGKGMEAIVKLLRAMRGKDEDSIEGMLNKGGLGDILKDLNQQGARAGIVFAGLSQNVGELERQLEIAHSAFEENVAIQREYNRMQETTAGKLARLENTITNFFVRASSSKILGMVYDFLSWFFDNWINNPKFYLFFNVLIGYLTVVKVRLAEIVAQGAVAAWGSLVSAVKIFVNTLRSAVGATKDLSTGLDIVNKKEKAMAMANAWVAIATAVVLAVKAIKDWQEEIHKVDTITNEALGKVERVVSAATDKVDEMFQAMGRNSVAMEEAEKRFQAATKAVEAAKEALDGSRESTERLKDAENELKLADEARTKTNDAHAASIQRINTEYSPYLGYMLSEISSAKELANARELINAKLRETLTLKQREVAYGRLEEEYGEDVDKEQASLEDKISKMLSKNIKMAASVTKEIRKRIQDKDLINDPEKLKIAVQGILNENGIFYDPSKAGTKYAQQNAASLTIINAIQNAAERTRKAEAKLFNARQTVASRFEAYLSGDRKEMQREANEQLQAIVEGDEGKGNGLTALQSKYMKASEKDRKQVAADLLQQMDAYEEYVGNAKTFYNLEDEKEKSDYDAFIKAADERMKGWKEERENLVKVAGDTYKKIQKDSGITVPKPSVWGNKPNADTPYSDWNADDLVARRKSMNTFVRALQSGTDIQAVLKQDAAFQKAYAAGLIKNERDAIEWYNTERLKIQDELHARHLTNTGDWMDPKKGSGGKKAAEKAAKEEMKAALDALDAYYIERDARIKEAQNTGEITEAEAQRRIEKNDLEHYKRREELRMMFLQKTEHISQEEQDAIMEIIDIEGDGLEFTKKQFANTVKFLEQLNKYGSSIHDSIYKNAKMDMNLQQQTIQKHQKAIDAILSKGFDQADKAYEQFKHTLDTLGVMLNGGQMETSVEAFLQTTRRLAEHVRDAWKYRDSDDFFEKLKAESEETMGKLAEDYGSALLNGTEAEQQALLARMEAERKYYDWLVSTDKSSRNTMLTQLQEFGDDYDEAVAKMVKQQTKAFERRFANSPEGRELAATISEEASKAAMRDRMYDALGGARGATTPGGTPVFRGRSKTTTETEKSVRVTTKTKTTTTDPDNRVARMGTLSDSGMFGDLARNREEIDLIDQKIRYQEALMQSNYELMKSEIAKIETQKKEAEQRVLTAEQEMKANADNAEAYAAAEAKKKQAVEEFDTLSQRLAAQQQANEEMMLNQQTALDQLWQQRNQKVMEVNNALMEGIEGYVKALDSFAERAGELIGEGAFGDPERRREAGRELLKDVIKVTGSLLKQWMTYMVTKKYLDEAEVKMNEAKNIKMLISNAMMANKELTIQGAEAQAGVTLNQAEAASKEAAKKGLIGLAIGAAIGVALTALMSAAMSRLTQSKSEISSIAGTNAGRLSTGMLTYAKGNVQEVVGDDGVTYRARNVGRARRTHITQQTELTEVGGKPAIVGEKGSELVVPAATTKRLQMNYPGILKAISLVERQGSLGGYGYGGGMRRGVRRFADGNLEEIENGELRIDDFGRSNGISQEQAAAMTAALDNAAAAYDRLTEQLKKPVYINMYGPEGLRARNAEADRFEKRYGKSYG